MAVRLVPIATVPCGLTDLRREDASASEASRRIRLLSREVRTPAGLSPLRVLTETKASPVRLPMVFARPRR